MVDPISDRFRREMNTLAKVLDEHFNGEGDVRGPKKVCFTLLITEFGKIEDGRVNYISNGQRDDIVKMMEELLGRFKGPKLVP